MRGETAREKRRARAGWARRRRGRAGWGVAIGEGAAGRGPRAGGRRECHLEESLDFCEKNIDSRVGLPYFDDPLSFRSRAARAIRRQTFSLALADCAYTSTCLLQGNETGWHQS